MTTSLAFGTVLTRFDTSNKNWSKNFEYNYAYLRAQENYYNDLLRFRGVVFLNEVLDGLGIERTQDGQRLGWAFSDETPNQITFEIDKMADGSLRIWFDTDGDVLERLPR